MRKGQTLKMTSLLSLVTQSVQAPWLQGEKMTDISASKQMEHSLSAGGSSSSFLLPVGLGGASSTPLLHDGLFGQSPFALAVILCFSVAFLSLMYQDCVFWWIPDRVAKLKYIVQGVELLPKASSIGMARCMANFGGNTDRTQMGASLEDW